MSLPPRRRGDAVPAVGADVFARERVSDAEAQGSSSSSSATSSPMRPRMRASASPTIVESAIAAPTAIRTHAQTAISLRSIGSFGRRD